MSSGEDMTGDRKSGKTMRKNHTQKGVRDSENKEGESKKEVNERQRAGLARIKKKAARQARKNMSQCKKRCRNKGSPAEKYRR